MKFYSYVCLFAINLACLNGRGGRYLRKYNTIKQKYFSCNKIFKCIVWSRDNMLSHHMPEPRFLCPFIVIESIKFIHIHIYTSLKIECKHRQRSIYIALYKYLYENIGRPKYKQNLINKYAMSCLVLTLD